MIKLVSLLLILSVCISGCVPAIIGAVAYNSGKKKESRSQFMNDFNQTNIEREKAGLPPLDLCTEKYNFDEGWANNDPVCAERIDRYEAGDTTALGNPQLEVSEKDDNAEPEIQRNEDKEPVTP